MAKAFCKTAVYADKLRNFQTLNISFECTLPFWSEPAQSQAMLAYIGGGLEFPLVTPTEFDMLGYRSLVDNDSDATVPIEMHVDGGSENPKITNVTIGVLILIERRVETWEQLYINTDPEHMEGFDSTPDDPRQLMADDWANYIQTFITNGILNGGTNLQ